MNQYNSLMVPTLLAAHGKPPEKLMTIKTVYYVGSITGIIGAVWVAANKVAAQAIMAAEVVAAPISPNAIAAGVSQPVSDFSPLIAFAREFGMLGAAIGLLMWICLWLLKQMESQRAQLIQPLADMAKAMDKVGDKMGDLEKSMQSLRGVDELTKKWESILERRQSRDGKD